MSAKEYIVVAESRTPTKVEADKLRHEAKVIFRRLHGIDDGESNGMLEKLVDCIIECAVLEMVDIQNRNANVGTTERY